MGDRCAAVFLYYLGLPDTIFSVFPQLLNLKISACLEKREVALHQFFPPSVKSFCCTDSIGLNAMCLVDVDKHQEAQ